LWIQVFFGRNSGRGGCCGRKTGRCYGWKKSTSKDSRERQQVRFCLEEREGESLNKRFSSILPTLPIVMGGKSWEATLLAMDFPKKEGSCSKAQCGMVLSLDGCVDILH
jgi:hypothetical protein